MKIAAAAITAAISPPLGVAVAAGSALRSARVRGALRKGTVQALAGAIQLGDQLAAAAQRGQASAPEPPIAPEPATDGQSSTPKPS
jgi:hypothetical protein